jgi:putative ABC transport system permease protein
VLERAGADPHGTDRDDEVHVPVTTAMRRLQNVDYVNAAKLVVTEGEDLTAVTGEVAAVLRERHALPPEARDDFTLVTPRQVMDMIRSSERVFSLFLPLLAGAALLVAGIVVANLMFMAVNERRAEIGLRKAVGACARDVRLQLLVECATVTLAGGVLGVAASWLGLRALPGVLPGVVPGWQGGAGGPGGSMASMSSMPWEAALLGLASAILVGVLAGLAPARAAARLDPVRALR